QANRLPYGLAAYCFTENGRRALLLGDAIESGMIGINTTMIGGADSPFGGVKDSGHGSEDGPEGLEECLVLKAIHQAGAGGYDGGPEARRRSRVSAHRHRRGLH